MAPLASTRFSDSSQIEKLIKTGSQFKTIWAKLTSQPSSHFTLTISVSKKQIPLSTKRNYQRRRLRNAINQLQTKHPQTFPKFNLIIFPYSSIQDITFEQILIDLQKWINFTKNK